MATQNAEAARLAESPGADDLWRKWGPYLSGRQWGVVREDYSADGDAWASFPFDQAHLRAYRWGEDGIAGLTDRYGFLCLAVALWNGHDDRLKERLFGLTNAEGNHGEDAKEYWWHLDATPTHSYAEYLYRYPQAAYPYRQLREVNHERGREDPEFELADTGVLGEDRFFDVHVCHAKAAPEDILVVITATNQGPDPAPLDLIPQLWFRNTWRWGRDGRTPSIRRLGTGEAADGAVGVECVHAEVGTYRLLAEGSPELMFCDNESNDVELYDAAANPTPYPKNGIDQAVVHGNESLLNPEGTGTKVGLRYHVESVAPGASVTVRLRFTTVAPSVPPFGNAYDAVVADRKREADAFYDAVLPVATDAEDRLVARRAFAGLNWCKQIYRYDVREWLQGDPASAAPPDTRLAAEPTGRNTSWRQLSLADVISMPDEWEYPWFASWDLAFHCVTLAHIDPAFAKQQLLLMCREWSQHPDGQLPAYEWSFSDVNPPVHAWAAWHVFTIDGKTDHAFLERVFSKLLLNFAWWVNRKDADGSNLFEGGFLGMDNISLFDRSREVPPGWRLEQSDATSWMAFFCLSMLRIAQELARRDDAWDDLATTFLERFFLIAEAMESLGTDGVSLWDEQDGFFYDALVGPHGSIDLPVRSLVGLLPLLAVAASPDWVSTALPDFTARLAWLKRHRPEETDGLITTVGADGKHHTLALVHPSRYKRVLARMLDEAEFLSPYGIRSLSAAYRNGFSTQVDDMTMGTRYDPGESTSGLFGGNSNWRGPVWFPVNVLLADALRTYGRGAGGAVTVELPTGSGNMAGLVEVADELERRLVLLFRRGPDGRRPSDPRDHGGGPLWSPYPTFSEYFHGDTGVGLGASHQTGWTALVAHLICRPTPDSKH